MNNKEINSQTKTIADATLKTMVRRKVEGSTFERLGEWMTKASKCNFSSIKQYFDVTQDIIIQRLIYSLIPFNPYINDILNTKPDLYGPLWIFTTLVFIIAASGEISSYLYGNISIAYFEQFVPLSALLIYGVGVGLPVILYAFMKFFGSEPSFIKLQAIYGYAFTSYLPAAIICIIPSRKIHLMIMAIAVVISTSLIVINCWKDISQYAIKSRTYFLLALILIAQVVIYIVNVFYFFGLEKKYDPSK